MPITPAPKATRQQIIDDIAATLTDAWSHLGHGSITPAELAQKWAEIRAAVEAIYPP